MNGSRELITCVQRHGGTIGNNKLGEGRAVSEDPFEVLLESVKVCINRGKKPKCNGFIQRASRFSFVLWTGSRNGCSTPSLYHAKSLSWVFTRSFPVHNFPSTFYFPSPIISRRQFMPLTGSSWVDGKFVGRPRFYLEDSDVTPKHRA